MCILCVLVKINKRTFLCLDEPQADKWLSSSSHFSPFKCRFVAKIRMLCFVLINSVLSKPFVCLNTL